MSYREDQQFPTPRTDDSALDLRQLLKDIETLIDAGLVVRLLDRDGEVRVTLAAPLERDLDTPAS